MSAEGVRVGKCRINSNVYPAVSCVAGLYAGVGLPISTSTNIEDVADNASIGKPVSFRAIQDCMRVYFGRSSPELVRRGLIPAVGCLGYVEVVKGPYRVKYIPTLMGVIDSAIYLALFNTLLSELDKYGIKLSPETVHALVRFMRLMVFWESLRKYDDVPWLIDEKLYYKLLNCDECLSQGSCLNNPNNTALYCKISEKNIKRWREEFLYSAIITKAIAGVEVRGIEPKQLGIVFRIVFTKSFTIASNYAKKFITPSDSAEVYSIFRTTYSEIKDNPLFKTMEDIHRVLDTIVGRAAVYLTSRLVGNLNKPVTGATVDSEDKQRRLRR